MALAHWTTRLLALAMAICFLSACGSNAGRGNGKGRGVCEPGKTSANTSLISKEEAYSLTVYPLAKKNCVSCHGVSQSPQFAKATLKDAFAEAEPLLERIDGKSVLEIKSADGHCGAQCNNSQPYTDEIAKYHLMISGAMDREGCATGSGGGGDQNTIEPNRLLTVSARLSNLTKTADTTITLGFSPSDTKVPAKYRNLTITVAAKAFTDPSGDEKGSVTFKNIRVTSPNSAVRVTKFLFALNGTVLTKATAYASLRVDIPQGTTPQVFSNGSTTILANWGANADEIQFTFIPEDSTGQAETEPQQFVRTVKPILSNRCMNCHNNPNVNGPDFMPNNDDTTLRNNIVTRSNRANPDASLLLTNATGTNHGGGTVLNPGNANDLQQINAIRDWMRRLP